MPRRRFEIVPFVLALAGCNWLPAKISDETLEAELIAWIADQGLTASEARCPSKQRLEQGKVFECVVVVDTVEIPVEVTVTDPSAGTVEWRPKYKTVTRQQLEDSIRGLPDLLGRELTLDCPGAVFVSVPKSTVSCEFFDLSTQKSFVGRLEFADGNGGYTWTVDPK